MRIIAYRVIWSTVKRISIRFGVMGRSVCRTDSVFISFTKKRILVIPQRDLLIRHPLYDFTCYGITIRRYVWNLNFSTPLIPTVWNVEGVRETTLSLPGTIRTISCSSSSKSILIFG